MLHDDYEYGYYDDNIQENIRNQINGINKEYLIFTIGYFASVGIITYACWLYG